MNIVRTVLEMRDVRSGLPGRVGLVPTMGALHAGHEALLARARAECKTVIASLFVNPAQFAPSEDYATYPRNRERDLEIFEARGTDVLFEPLVEEMYPVGESTRVDPGPIANVLEGAHRTGHFAGVATVVAKLFNIITPDAAYFGRKDAQQLVIVERLVRDLRMGIEIVPVETVRDTDGLALSSRNANLAEGPREAAAALYQGAKCSRGCLGERRAFRRHAESGDAGGPPRRTPDQSGICECGRPWDLRGVGRGRRSGVAFTRRVGGWNAAHRQHRAAGPAR